MDNKKVIIDYNRIRCETTIQFTADILNADDKKIGASRFTISLKNNQLRLKNFDITIFEADPEKMALLFFALKIKHK